MRVFLSFIGLGAAKRQEGTGEVISWEYREANYQFPGAPVQDTTRYVQVAILRHLARIQKAPDLVIFAMTGESERWHWKREGTLQDAIKAQGDRLHEQVLPVRIDESLETESQWRTFELLLEQIPEGSELFVDMTNGLRQIPILFSSAIYFLTRAKNVELGGVYYGVLDSPKQSTASIIDMKDFYTVNRWAEAVQRLLQDANPDAIAELAAKDTSLKLQNLESPELISALKNLSMVLKNADSPGVAEAVRAVVDRTRELQKGASPAADVLLKLILDKFSTMAVDGAMLRFSPEWYRVQLRMARVLLDHGLVMQGLTVLRELVVSWGEELAMHTMASPENPGRTRYLQQGKKLKDFKDGWFKQARRRIAEPFYARLYLDPAQWRPGQGEYDPDGSILSGILDDAFLLHYEPERQKGRFAFLKDLGNLRNSLNHAWTATRKIGHEQVQAQAFQHLEALRILTDELLETKAIGHGLAEFRQQDPSPVVRKVFLNLSNHPLATWSPEQLAAARALNLGEPTDLEGGMPQVDPEMDQDGVANMADELVARAVKQGAAGAHVSGEFSLALALVKRLQDRNIRCFVATTRRESECMIRDDGSAEKRSIFRFVRWRPYS